SQHIVKLDIPVMIISAILLFFISSDGTISRIDGIILFSGMIAYTVFLIYESRNAEPPVQEVFASKYQNKQPSYQYAILFNIGLIILGLVLLMLGSEWLISGATTIAKALGLSELIIGLTIVAIGTSLPEAATSIIACIRSESSIAVGNVIGSNIFNILAVMGLVGIVSPTGLAVSTATQNFDLPVVIATSIVCLPILFTGFAIHRWEGGLFLSYYVAYTMHLFLLAADSTMLQTFDLALGVVLPFTILIIVMSLLRALRNMAFSD
ncbi:sodium:calcium antiporter, partial [Achromatium sp. WMS2]